MVQNKEVIAGTCGNIYRAVQYEGITIEGESRGAVQTCWRIPEYRLGFDLGWQPWEFMGTPNWFISHTHMDHLLALPAYVARRRMMCMEPPTIYIHQSELPMAQQLLYIFTRLDRGALPCNFVGIQPGDSIALSRELLVTVVPTSHTIPSLGFIVWERRKKLKPEFANLSQNEIRDLNLAGVKVSNELQFPKVAYLGDSSCVGLDNNPIMYEAEVLITEMTFLAPSHRREARGRHSHLHLDDFVERKDLFKNKLIIASHFSTRYTNHQIIEFINKAFPDMMDHRLCLVF